MNQVEEANVETEAGVKRRRENRSNNRVKLEKTLKVVMASIGSEVRYELSTRNVSITGFFLDFDKPGRFPFTPSSIMEVWLELGEGKTIFFNGKMARVVFPQDELAKETGPGIGIKIVQIDRENEQILHDFVKGKVSELDDNDGVA